MPFARVFLCPFHKGSSTERTIYVNGKIGVSVAAFRREEAPPCESTDIHRFTDHVPNLS
jgi:hypothetical protein